MRIVILLIACTAVAGCSRPSAGATGPTSSKVRIIAAEEALRAGLPAERHAVAFDDDRDGTALVRTFLMDAWFQGAPWVSGLELHIITHEAGVELDCASALAPAQEITKATPGEHATRPATQLTTRELRVCGPQAALAPSALDPGTTEAQPDLVCTTETITQFQYQADADYEPARLDDLSVQFSKWQLVEGPPRCAPAVAGSRHRVEGIIHRRPGT